MATPQLREALQELAQAEAVHVWVIVPATPVSDQQVQTAILPNEWVRADLQAPYTAEERSGQPDACEVAAARLEHALDATADGSVAIDDALAEALSTCEDAAASEGGDWFACSQAMEAVEVSDPDVEAARDKVILWADQLGKLEDPDELLEDLDEEEAAEVIERQIAPLASIHRGDPLSVAS